MNYQKFAHVYDVLMEEAPYDKWITFTQHMINEHFPNAASIVDIGCGTGEIAIRLAEKGYKIAGVDLSSDMLSIANQKARDQNLSTINWVNQNMIDLEMGSYFDLAVSFCDVINYIIDEDDLLKCFKRVNKSLNSNGLFLFDVHSETYLNEFLSNHTFADVQEDLSYIWFCEKGEYDSMVEHFLTFFIKNQHDMFDRFDEYHVQRTFPRSFYENLLRRTGFQILGIYSDFSLTEFNEKSDRLFFVCQKKSNEKMQVEC